MKIIHDCILILITVKLAPNGPFDKKSSLVQVIAWLLSIAKPLATPMMTWFNDTYGGVTKPQLDNLLLFLMIFFAEIFLGFHLFVSAACGQDYHLVTIYIPAM